MLTVCTATAVNTSKSAAERCLPGANLNMGDHVAAALPGSRMANR